MFDDPQIVGVRVMLNGERVDVADLGFICDGDELIIVRESELAMEASGSTNTQEVDDNGTRSVVSNLEESESEDTFDPGPRASNNPPSLLNESDIAAICPLVSDWITLNVGGTKFMTCRSTIEMKVTVQTMIFLRFI